MISVSPLNEDPLSYDYKVIGKRDITINAVAPGFISTDMTEQNNGVNADYLIKEIPISIWKKNTFLKGDAFILVKVSTILDAHLVR